MSINFPNSQNNIITKAEVQKRLDSQENFTALNKEQLQQDAIEIAGKTKEKVKENWIFSTLRNTFGVEDPKKLLTSVGLTILTVVGGAVLGNKLSNKTASLGITVDELAKKSNVYQSISGFFKKGRQHIVDFLKKSKTMQDVAETMQNRKAKPRCDMTRGYGRGFVSIFSLTPVDVLDKAFKKAGIDDLTKATDLMKKLVGDTPEAEKFAIQILGQENLVSATNILKKVVPDASIVSEVAKKVAGVQNPKKLTRILQQELGNLANLDSLVEEIISKKAKRDNRAFCEALSNAMRKHCGATDNKSFLNALKELQEGTFNGVSVPEFKNVDMTGGGITGSWWPVNIINSIGKKLKLIPQDKGFCRGNLGDSLVKFNVVDGKLADTAIGKLVQKSITVPTESITNFVNDKSGLGVFLCASIISLYNNVQNAPKEKRVATVADDYIGTIGSIALATPAAFGATYGLASLKNLKGDTFISKGLKQIGKFFGMGLEKYAKNGNAMGATSNIFLRFGGGALRFALIMFAFAPIIQKPLRAAIHKIFGKPYNEMEEKQKAAIEQQKNTVIPELGITQQQLLDKIQNNPDKVKALDNQPELVQKIQNNPGLLVDYLDGKDITKTNETAIEDKKTPIKPLQKIQVVSNNDINKFLDKTSKNSAINNVSNEKNTSAKTSYDTATYIPSSEFSAKNVSYTDEQIQRINSIMNDADSALKRAEKFI